MACACPARVACVHPGSFGVRIGVFLTDKQAQRSKAIARLGLWSAYPARTRPATPAARTVPPLVAVALLSLMWWALARVTPAVLLPDPVGVAGRVIHWVGSGIGWRYAWPTLAAALLGSGLALLVALPLGFVVAHSRLLGAIIEPFVAFSQTVPLVAVAPLLVLWVGYGTAPIAMLCAIIAFFPMVTTTVVGLRGLDMRIIETAWLDGAGAWQRLIHLEVPVAAPAILAGVRGGVVLSMTGAIVGEFVMGGEGLGTLLTISREAADTTGVFAVLILIALIAAALVASLSVVERAAIRNLQGEHS